MPCQPVVRRSRSRIAAAYTLASRRVSTSVNAGAMLILLSISMLWPAQAMAQLMLSVDDVSVAEGDAGSSSIFFDVRLNSPAPPGGIAFEFSTSDGSADTTDYDGTSYNRGRINEGFRQARIEIGVYGDYDVEPDETFFLNLINATGATIGDGQGVGTLLDDDRIPRRLSIDDAVATRVNAPPTIMLQSSPNTLSGNQFQPFSARINAAGGVAPYAFAVTGGRLPNGVTLGTDGLLSGTPTENGPFFFTVSATDHVPGIPQTASRDFSIYIASAPLSLTPPTLPTGYLNESYSHPLTALGGLPPYAFRLSAGTLPPSVQLLSNGAIHGTPTAIGQHHFSVTASDSAVPTRSEATVEYSIDIVARPLQLDPKSLAPITGGAAFQTLFSAGGGTSPYAFTISAGSLPPGLSLTSSGALQGAPTAIGSFGFDVQVADGAGATAARTFQLEVVLPVVTISSALSDGQVGSRYSRSVFANGGLQPYTFSVTAGALPPGLELDTRGIVIGVPTAAGSYTFALTVADNNISFGPVTASRTYTVRIEPSGFVFGPDILPNARTDELYQQRFSALYGMPPYRYAFSAGALPSGLYLSNDVLYGTPTQAGTYAFSITGSDGRPDIPSSYTRDYILVVELSAVEIYPFSFPEATAGRYYNQTISARGGIRPYRYRLAGGALPPGLSVGVDGYVSGTPTGAGHFTFTLQVDDSASGTASTATREFNLTVALPQVNIDTARLQPAAVGSNHFTDIIAHGGQAPYTYALTTGTLPAGLELMANGRLQGVPEVVGSFEITITATDSGMSYGPVSGSRSYTLIVEPRRLSVYPRFMPHAVEGIPYSVKLKGLNGAAPYRFTVTNGKLPPGLSLDTDGTISGIPGRPPRGSNSSYQYFFALTIVDADSVSAIFPYLGILLRGQAPSISPASVPAGIAGISSYQQPFTAVSATAPYALVWESGTLPKGLRFDPATVTLSGIPLETGRFPFQLRLTDAENRMMVRDYVLDIASPTLALIPDILPNGVSGTHYTQAFFATGGIAPYRYLAVERNGDSLPTGLSLSEDGLLQGTPTTAGVFTFVIIATDSTGGLSASIRHRYTMSIAAPSIAIDPATLPKAIAGLDYAQTLTAQGGTAPYMFSISAGALPPGLTLTAAGVLSGTPTEVGSSSVTVTATDALGFTAARAYTITVTVPKPVPVSRVLSVVAGGTLTMNLTEGASGGPFTAAALISLSPSDAGTAQIVRVDDSYRLQFTAAHAFSGRAIATFTLINAFATSAPATVFLDVAPRPDPTQRTDVRGLLSAQTESTHRFATTQVNNFVQRLERMHGASEESGFDNSVSVAYRQYCPPMVGALPGRRCERRAAGETDTHRMQQARGKGSNAAFGVWASGMIRSGNHDGRNRDPSIDFETDGVSVGADYRLSKAFAFGGGLGYGRDESDIGDNGTRSESDAVSLALYASYSPGERWFADALLGYQSLGFDLRRPVAANGNVVVGSRDGRQWFGSLSTGVDIQKDAWQFTPYARLDAAQATLDEYTESGDPLYALTYDDMDVETMTVNAGLRIDYRREVSWGLWSPQFRVEYQHDFKGNGAQTLRYADLPAGPFYRADLNGFDRSRLMLGLGMLFNFDNDWSFKLDYRGLIGSGGDTDHGVQFNVDKKF